MGELLQILAILAIANQMAMVAASSIASPTSAAFKKSHILRDSDQMATATIANSLPYDSDNNDSSNDAAADDDGQLSLQDQVRLLNKQMNALMTRRREDFKLLEINLKKSIRKNAQQYADAEILAELEKLR